MTKPETLLGYGQVYKHIYNGSPRGRREKENYFKNVMAKNFSDLITVMNLYIQESQQTPSRITQRHLHQDTLLPNC